MEVSAANYFLVSFEPYVEAVKQFCRFFVPIIDDWPLWSLCVIMIKMTLILKLMIILFPGREEEKWIITYERRRKKLRLHCLWLSSVIEINFKISKLVVMRSKYFILIFTLYSFHHSHDEHNLSLLVFNILPESNTKSDFDKFSIFVIKLIFNKDIANFNGGLINIYRKLFNTKSTDFRRCTKVQFGPFSDQINYHFFLNQVSF